jgi:hypothetical protein
MKSKENQTIIKNIETLLSSYFTNLVDQPSSSEGGDTATTPPMKIHPKIREYEQNYGSTVVVKRITAFNVNLEEVITSFKNDIYQKKGPSLAWISLMKESGNDMETSFPSSDRMIQEERNPNDSLPLSSSREPQQSTRSSTNEPTLSSSEGLRKVKRIFSFL